jgi:transcriptional regulator with XRE-family HTH domain
MDWRRLLREIQVERTQDELAQDLGISQSMVSRLLAGTRHPGPKVVRGILQARPSLTGEVSRAFLGGGA